MAMASACTKTTAMLDCTSDDELTVAASDGGVREATADKMSPLRQFLVFCISYGVLVASCGTFGHFMHRLRTARICGDGFIEQPGDLPHFGYKLPGNLNAPTTDDCAGKCDSTEGCESYEYSPTKQLCNLNKGLEPELPPFEDYVFCSKKAAHSMFAGFAVLVSMLVLTALALVPPRILILLDFHPALVLELAVHLALLAMLIWGVVFFAMAYINYGERRALLLVLACGSLCAFGQAFRLKPVPASLEEGPEEQTLAATVVGCDHELRETQSPELVCD